MNKVLNKAVEVFGDIDKAYYWYYNHTCKGFGGLSPWEVHIQGGEQEVLEILEQIDSGYY